MSATDKENIIILGRVTGSNSGVFTVDTEYGETVSIHGRGRFRYERMRLLPGDITELRLNSDGRAFPVGIRERKNCMIRPPLANLDILFCVASVVSPKVDVITFDKLIVSAEKKKIEPVIIVTKSDEDEEAAEHFADIYRKCGFSAFAVSNLTGKGINDIQSFLQERKDCICALSGASGVGKSSLLNMLFGNSDIEVGSLSEKIKRGKQTTRQSRLYPLSRLTGISDAKGYLADTPGFSMLDFLNFDFCDADELPGLFREFSDFTYHCRYTKCRHLREEGCSVIAAVNENIIPLSRHKSYTAIYEEIKDKHPWNK